MMAVSPALELQTHSSVRAHMPRLVRLILAVIALACFASALGCTTHYIPNTDVEDTGDNRKIVAFCEKYRLAVERKDIGTLVSLASPDYFEDGGNVDATDDENLDGLRDYLTTKFNGASAIRYEIRYRRVTKAKKYIYVDYTFTASYRIPTARGDEWRRNVEDNRLELEPYNEEYRIRAGM